MTTAETTSGAIQNIVEAADRDDPDLLPIEKETTFRFASSDDRIEFFSAEASLIRRLAAHPESDVEEVTVREGEHRLSRDPAEVGPDDHVVGVRGTMPIGVMGIKSQARSATGHANIVSARVLEEVDK